MSEIYKCDICGRTAEEGADIEHYKLKKKYIHGMRHGGLN